jgi:uncharacterized protein (TIGR02599 family)
MMNPLHKLQAGRAAALTRHRRAAFTLVEVLVSITILAMIMAIVTQVLGQAQRSWKAASSRVTQFSEARQAFDTVTRNLRQASLPTYWDWAYDASGTKMLPDEFTDPPVTLVKRAYLGFACGPASSLVTGGGSSDALPGHAVVFQAPTGYSTTTNPTTGAPMYDQLDRLLCARGYFVRFSSDAAFVPAALTGRLAEKHRFRLYEYGPPTELNPVFATPPPPTITADGGTSPVGTWMTIDASSMEKRGGGAATSPSSYIRPVAENILIMAFAVSFSSPTGVGMASLGHPASSSSESVSFFSSYNSYTGALGGGSGSSLPQTNRLPRAVEVMMVALDEESATKLSDKYGRTPPPVLSRAGASFSKTSEHDTDIKRLREALQKEKLNFRIFNTIILLPASDT